ncbi:dihydroneopterin triphosphate diphosphatase [Chitinasiproducens palmae]|uniref:Dihydroneopterin triphosphate pyrophosphatase n=1 Tax=Chitinasiproducens palmae TaxID=1770053 RepID=A0A1H2PPE5_9BURK|nr:dihydroneopterin triphosphate diphosphatase [Chitinasiproducens palmae]SDV48163.1 dihydroneopterin triphosphate pyrophosphatase [Chitinasiproducens palmae]
MTRAPVLAPEARPARAPKIPESVLVVIHSPDLEVLLIERADCAGFWQSVTGSKDRLDEPLRAVASREVGEETGIVVGGPRVPAAALRDMAHAIEYDIYPQWRHRYASGVVRNTEHWFALEVPRDVEIVLAPREHVAFRWLPWQEAVRQCFSPSNGDAIRRLVRDRNG